MGVDVAGGEGDDVSTVGCVRWGGVVHTLALGPLLLSFLRSCRCWRHFVRYAMGDGGDTVSEVEVLQGQPNSASAGLARGLTQLMPQAAQPITDGTCPATPSRRAAAGGRVGSSRKCSVQLEVM